MTILKNYSIETNIIQQIENLGYLSPEQQHFSEAVFKKKIAFS